MLAKGFWIIVIVGAFWALISFLMNASNLPPTSQQNHIEESPASHILTTPIPEKIQRHMIEHSDGDERKGSGILIQ